MYQIELGFLQPTLDVRDAAPPNRTGKQYGIDGCFYFYWFAGHRCWNSHSSYLENQ